MTPIELITILVAGYAAVVATAALALELKRWWESGPKLVSRVEPEMVRSSSLAHKPFRYIIVTITNRGDTPSTVTHLGLVDYETTLNRIIGRKKWSVIVPKPEGNSLPAKIEPGEHWAGGILYDDELTRRRDGGKLFLNIAATHRDKILERRVRKPSKITSLDSDKNLQDE